MLMRTNNDLLPTDSNRSSGGRRDAGGGGSAGGLKEWELRPGGMLVQKRTDGGQTRLSAPTIRVRVKHGSIYHEIRINSQATFGELKKMLSGLTGLHHQDQKLFYKDKERDANAYLDSVGMKDKSKLVLEEDAISKEKRFLEMRKKAKMEKAASTLSVISLEVDRLAGQVSGLETVISEGGKVVEKDVVNLIELLMNQLLKLDGIIADGDVKLNRKMQVTRVQKYVEKLDALKLKNSNQVPLQQQKHSNDNSLIDCDAPKQEEEEQQKASMDSASGGAVVITTQWETFDFASTSNPFTGSPSTPSMEKNNVHPTQPSFTWNLL